MAETIFPREKPGGYSRGILCLSTQDWDHLWTRKQRFMSRFAERGIRVLYVNQQMHFLGYLKHLRTQWSRAFTWLAGSRNVQPDLYVYTLPPVLPFFQMSPLINRINNIWIAFLLRGQLKRIGVAAPILWLYPPHAVGLVEPLGGKRVVYDCVDDFPAMKGLVAKRVMATFEDELLRRADLTIVTAQTLYDERKDKARRIRLIPNGVEPDHFVKAASPNTPVSALVGGLPKPIIGFLGSVAYWIDLDLIAAIARSHPEWSVVLVGPVTVGRAIQKVRILRNVHVLNRQPYPDLPGILKAFDVCINPFVVDDLARGADPLKLYEYLATGKPVVSVDLPEAARFGRMVRIARSPEDFIRQIELALRETDPETARARTTEARKNAWNERFARVVEALSELDWIPAETPDPK